MMVNLQGGGIMLRTWVVTIAVMAGATPAFAQSGSASRPCGGGGSWSNLFTDTVKDFRQLPSSRSLGILAGGAAAALGTHFADARTVQGVSDATALRGPFRPGATIGGTPLQMAGSIATYSFGRAFNKPCAASVGADLFRAQLMAQGLTIALKQATRRSRPEGSGYSFPSGHATVSFASATVLQQHFGWKVGIPAYAVASYVAASRVEMKRHYLSDVAFGAALGIVAGRTVSIGGGRRLMFAPMATPNGAGASFTWVGR